MAEFITKDMIHRRGISHLVSAESCATSNEEIGNDIYPPVQRILSDHNIPFEHRRARRMTSADYSEHELIIAMDRYNVMNMRSFVKDDPEMKVKLIMEYLGEKKDVDDPWYTGEFGKTFNELSAACSAMLDSLELDR